MIDNIDFDMNMMARELGLSRSSLYAKFKALTGMTPNDFVLSCKLKRAATMLTAQPDLQIADISDRLGFGSPRYFTRCFKAQFEITPAEYRKRAEKNALRVILRYQKKSGYVRNAVIFFSRDCQKNS